MGIIVSIVCGKFFINKTKKNHSLFGYTPIFILVAFIVLGLTMNLYQEHVQGWENGIASIPGEAGADYYYHYEAAQRLLHGASISELGNFAYRFELSLDKIGYIVYVIFLAIMLFPMSGQFALFFVYATQSMIAVMACMNMARYFWDKGNLSEWGVKTTFWCLALCVSVFQAANILMRDIWIFYFISLFMQNLDTLKKKLWRSLLYILVMFLFRSYTLLITVPILALSMSNKIAIIGSLCIAAILVVGVNVMKSLVSYFNVLWQISFKIEIPEILKYFFFPNIINQSKNLIDVNNAIYHGSPGSNHTIIYYLLSVWNIVMVPCAFCGLIKAIIKRKWLFLVWALMILNIGMFYAILYGGISEPRHKLMILPALAFLSSYFLDKINLRKRIMVGCLFAIGCLLIMLWAVI